MSLYLLFLIVLCWGLLDSVTGISCILWGIFRVLFGRIP